MNPDTNTVTDLVTTIDFGQTLETMIAAGKYDWKNDRITAAYFPIEGTGIKKVRNRLFHFGRDISSKDAVAAIKADDPHTPWEPARIEHLLAFGAAYPDEQRQYPIIGLGSVAKVFGIRHVPDLNWLDAKRFLVLSWWGVDWIGYCRFLAVRELSSAA
ncbi:hypothetical protein V1283_008288 [Bradyrhizobium sp. AZCC 2262]|uniref:hypothetical protein n=1 Tax=Bradyrhizobium sp. AZCC 2262 TaxID=3117022 RepID=UPI002FF10937